VAFHDGLAATWDERYASGGFGRRAEFFRGMILPLLPAGGDWLDAGCGSGFFSRMLAGGNRVVTGVDASQAMIGEAERRAAAVECSDKVRFLVVPTIEKLDFGDDHFDGCISLSVLEYLDAPLDCLDELARATRVDGTIVVSVPDGRSIIRRVERVARAFRHRSSTLDYLSVSRWALSPAALEAHLRRRHFRDIRLFGFDPIVPSALRSVLPPSLLFAVARKGRR
jgi:SAM-dependent methyltransferase